MASEVVWSYAVLMLLFPKAELLETLDVSDGVVHLKVRIDGKDRDLIFSNDGSSLEVKEYDPLRILYKMSHPK